MSSLVVAVAVLFVFFAGSTTYEWYVRKDYRYWKLRILYLAAVNPAFLSFVCTGGGKALVAAFLWIENIIVFYHQLKPLSKTYMPRRWRELMAPYMAYSISIAGIISAIFYTNPNIKGAGSLFVMSFFSAIIITLYNIWEFVVIDKEYPEDNPYQEVELVPLPEEKVTFDPIKKPGRKDLLSMCLLTAFSALLIFHKLGNPVAPQTALSLSSCDYKYFAEDRRDDIPQESKIDLQFQDEEFIEGISLYVGDKDTSVVRVEARSGENTWTIIQDALQLDATYRWNSIPIQMKANAIRVLQRDGDGKYLELAVRVKNTGEETEKERLLLPNNWQSYGALFDEQSLYPEYLTYYDQSLFDEVYYASSMYQFLQGENMREQTHPPLGKAIMSIGMYLFGPTPFGWRFVSAFLGGLMVPVMYLFLHGYLHNTRYATAGTFLFCIDFLHITLSRIGTPDTLVAFAMLVTMMYYHRAIERIRNYGFDKTAYRLLGIYSFCIGVCISLKWTGVFLLFGCILAYFRCITPYSKKMLGLAAVFHCLIPGTLYVLSFVPFYAKMGYQNFMQAALEHSFDMLRFHETAMKGHEFASPWFTWMFDIRPLVDIVSYVDGGKVSTVATFGHPILWPIGLVCFLFIAFRAAYREDKRASFFATLYFGLLFPWFFIKRTTFIYQYYGCSLVTIPIITYVMYRIDQRSNTRINQFFLILCTVVFLLFCPVLTGEPISKTWIEQMLVWMQGWNFY